MTALPSVEVTQEQATILLAPFATDDDYRAFVRGRLVDYVIDREQKRMASEALAEQRTALDALRLKLQ